MVCKLSFFKCPVNTENLNHVNDEISISNQLLYKLCMTKLMEIFNDIF